MSPATVAEQSPPPAVTRDPDCATTDLSHLALIRVSGPDTRSFLQGQLTNDINAVTAEKAQLSSYCSPKGRMMACFWVFQRADDLFIQLPADRLEPILKRLRMFVLRAQVTLEDATAGLARTGISGDCAATILPFAPEAAGDTLTRDELTLLRLPGERPRFELIGPTAAVAGALSGATRDLERADAEFWALQDIRAGIPNVYQETSEAFVPQMANLQLVGGISFTKGCYTGQEVVARMQYLGKLKRRMYRARVATPERPLPGTELYARDSDSGQGTGRVVDSAAAADGIFELLIVLQISSAKQDGIRLVDEAGPVLELLDLPYAFEQADT